MQLLVKRKMSLAYPCPWTSLVFSFDEIAIIFTIFIITVINMVKMTRWERVEDLLAYGLLMLALLVLPTSLVTGRYNHHQDTFYQKRIIGN